MKNILKIDIINNYVKTPIEVMSLIRNNDKEINVSFNYENLRCTLNYQKDLDILSFKSVNKKEEYILNIKISLLDKKNNMCNLSTKFGLINLEMINAEYEIREEYMLINYQIKESDDKPTMHSLIVYLK